MAEETQTPQKEQELRLPDPADLLVSSSPHLRSPENVRRIMALVILALLPACIVGVILFGIDAVEVLVVCCISCVVFETMFCKLLKRPVSIADGSALLTGLLLGMNLSACAPWWMCVVGSLLAMGLGKHIYGGLGYNPFNPALVGRVGLLIAFPSLMTTWVPARWMDCDTTTVATPLGVLQSTAGNLDARVEFLTGAGKSYTDYFLGNMPGCIGETSAAALLLGGLILIYFKLIRWQVPVTYIGTVMLITWVCQLSSSAPQHATPLLHLLTGGLMLGAFFMATDMVTSPMSKKGALIFGVGCGVITAVIRLWASYPEGVSFSILLMNALTPMIDRFTIKKPFGAAPPQKAEA